MEGAIELVNRPATSTSIRIRGVGTAISTMPVIERIERNEFDLIAVGRAHITNPDWAAKVRCGDLSSIKPFSVKDLKGLV